MLLRVMVLLEVAALTTGQLEETSLEGTVKRLEKSIFSHAQSIFNIHSRLKLLRDSWEWYNRYHRDVESIIEDFTSFTQPSKRDSAVTEDPPVTETRERVKEDLRTLTVHEDRLDTLQSELEGQKALLLNLSGKMETLGTLRMEEEVGKVLQDAREELQRVVLGKMEALNESLSDFEEKALINERKIVSIVHALSNSQEIHKVLEKKFDAFSEKQSAILDRIEGLEAQIISLGKKVIAEDSTKIKLAAVQSDASKSASTDEGPRGGSGVDAKLEKELRTIMDVVEKLHLDTNSPLSVASPSLSSSKKNDANFLEDFGVLSRSFSKWAGKVASWGKGTFVNDFHFNSDKSEGFKGQEQQQFSSN